MILGAIKLAIYAFLITFCTCAAIDTRPVNCVGTFNVKNELSSLQCPPYHNNRSIAVDNELDDLLDPDIPHFVVQNSLYWAFTDKDPSTPHDISYLNVSSITSLIELNPRLTVIVHGFKTKDLSAFYAIKDALFKLDDVSRRPSAVIVVDWREWAESAANFFAGYNTAAKNVYGIGNQLAYLLFALRVKRQLHEDNVHLIGHSLGAQLVGVAARKAVLSYKFASKIARVSGLDPAGPRFNDYNSFLSKDDAKFVDIVHTNAGDLSRGAFANWI